MTGSSKLPVQVEVVHGCVDCSVRTDNYCLIAGQTIPGELFDPSASYAVPHWCPLRHKRVMLRLQDGLVADPSAVPQPDPLAARMRERRKHPR